jgi:hypothetical protein
MDTALGLAQINGTGRQLMEAVDDYNDANERYRVAYDHLARVQDETRREAQSYADDERDYEIAFSCGTIRDDTGRQLQDEVDGLLCELDNAPCDKSRLAKEYRAIRAAKAHIVKALSLLDSVSVGL